MEYTVLGRTGLKISRLGFGGIPIQRSDAEGTKLVIDECEKRGINFIDTARGYTVSESFLGYALQGRRERFVLATKSMARTYDAMKADIDKSLADLRTNYIDLYQMHNIKPADFETAFGDEGAYKALVEAKAAGKIGFIGATCHLLAGFEQLVEQNLVDTVMFPFNIVESQGLAAMQAAAEKGIGFIAMKPVAGGNIDNKYLAIKYVLSNKNCTVAIPGMADVAEVKENCDAADDNAPLTAEQQKEIQAIIEELGQNFCRRCSYCAPCAAGIDIPTNIVFAGYLRKYGLADWAVERYASLKTKADACIKCGLCEQRCPYNLPVMEMVAAVDRDFAAYSASK